MATIARFAAPLGLALALGACTVHQTQPPPVSGPSDLSTSVALSATPDTLTRDGASQASIVALVRDAAGQPKSGVTLRMDMAIGGVLQDFGTLSARTIVSGTDGRASTIYTAPVPPPPSDSTLQRVSILATVVGANAQTSPAGGPNSVEIRLVPPGVILPPGGTPTAAFSMSPNQAQMNLPVTFDASASTPGTGATQITSYAWNFGDQSAGASGRTVSHTFAQQGTFNVTLTVTNDRGLSASTTTAVAVGVPPAPTGDWVFSPSQPSVNDTVFFNADGVAPSPGRQIVQYSWTFGDGGTASGFQATHVFTVAGVYNVTLSVLDDAGQKSVIAKTVPVSSGNPTAVFTFTPAAPKTTDTVAFNATASTAVGNATIVSYQWDIAGTARTGVMASVPPGTLVTGPNTVTLTVIDDKGRKGVTSQTVNVQ